MRRRNWSSIGFGRAGLKARVDALKQLRLRELLMHTSYGCRENYTLGIK
jgi:hypothetical protein